MSREPLSLNLIFVLSLPLARSISPHKSTARVGPCKSGKTTLNTLSCFKTSLASFYSLTIAKVLCVSFATIPLTPIKHGFLDFTTSIKAPLRSAFISFAHTLVFQVDADYCLSAWINFVMYCYHIELRASMFK
jgi:hypothetical protein